MTLLLSYMNFSNSACFGYGSSVTNPSFNETILKYFLQKYRMSSLHLFNSLARSLNYYGVNISFSPAFLIVASSLFESPFNTLLFGFMGLFNSSYMSLNLSKFKSLNLSIYTGSIMLFYNTDMLFSTPFLNSLFNSFKWFRLFTIFNLLSK